MEIPTDCLTCGVCCFSKSGTYITVSDSDYLRLADDAHHLVRHVGKGSFMRMVDGHCAAMAISHKRGQPAVFFCNVYERRPQVCRDLTRGKPACLAELHTKAARVAAEYGPR